MARIVTRTLRHSLIHMSRIVVLAILLAAGAATLSHSTTSHAQVIIDAALVYTDLTAIDYQPASVGLSLNTIDDTGNPAATCLSVRWGTNSQAGVSPPTARVYTGPGAGSITESSCLSVIRPITLTGLAPSTTYYYSVRAVDAADATNVTDDIRSGVITQTEFSFTTIAYTTTNINVTVSGTGPYSALLTWNSTATSAEIHYAFNSTSLSVAVNATKNITTGKWEVTVPGIPASTQVYFEFVYCATVGSCGTGLKRFPVGPITEVGTAVAAPSATGAMITWNTNMSGTQFIEYSTDSTLLTGLVRISNPVAPATSHSVTIPAGALDPGTQYFYHVLSDTTFDLGTGGSMNPGTYLLISPIYSFRTTGTAAPGDLAFTSGPDANASDSDAVITFETSVGTTALVEFNINPGLTPDSRTSGYSQACNAPAVCVPPPPVWDAPSGSTTHAITISGLTVPDRVYYYRVTAIDQYNRKISSAIMKFRTSLSRFDHTFTTGECPDGTKIRMCTPDGKFCRPGGIGPVYDCRPGILCTYMCPAGSTCQDTGDCIQDPSPGESLTACNPKSCYLKCDGASGDRSGKRCSVDGDCGAGKCIAGSFTIPAGPGCYGSWSSCDANVILKVRPDRVCNKWYTCKTSVDVGFSNKKTSNQCLDLTICDAISANGQCNNVLEGRQCSNDPLRFCKDDADCVGVGAFCLPAGTNKPMTFKSPEEVSQLKGLTGYAFAGLDWHSAYRWDKDTGAKIATPSKIDGLFPLSVMQQIGTKVMIRNADFEEYQTNFVCAKKTDVQCSPQQFTSSACSDGGTDNGPCISKRDTQALVARYWESVTPGGSFDSAGISVDAEASKNNPNQMLRITPTDLAESGARTTTDMNLTTGFNTEYMLSVRMKSTVVDQAITVALTNPTDADKTTHAFGTVTLSTSWQTYLLGPIKGVGTATISFLTADISETAVPFWIDDVSMLPALKVNDVQQPVPQTCRLYPNGTSEKCEYTSSSGVSFQGLMGYCLERDPLNAAICLSWWPVDVVSGNNIFGRDTAEGYNDRQPLFACAEAYGQWNERDPKNGQTIFTTGSSGNDPLECSDPRDGELCGQPLKNVRAMSTIVLQSVWNDNEDDGNCGRSVENRGACRDGTQRGFCACHKFIETSKVDADAYDQLIHEYDVEAFRVKAERWTGDFVGMDMTLSKGNNWSKSWTSGCATVSVSLEWDVITKSLKYYHFSLYGCKPSDSNGSGIFAVGLFYMKERCTKIVEVATQTSVMPWLDRTSKAGTYVVPDLSYRYASDFSPFGTAAAPSVTLDPKDWKTVDGNGILHVEGPDISMGSPYQVRGGAAYACGKDCSGRVCVFPSVTGSAISGSSCFTSADCITTSSPPIQGVCVGNGVCLDYDPDLNRFSYDQDAPSNTCSYNYAGGYTCSAASGKRAGRTCVPTRVTSNPNVDCQYTIGRCIPGASTGGGRCDKNSGDRSDLICNRDSQCQTTYNGTCVATACPDPTGAACCPAKNPICVGGRASYRGPQTLTPAASGYAPGLACSNATTRSCKTDADCIAPGQCIVNNAYFAQYHIERLFMRAYSLWTWNPATQEYEKTASNLWDAPIVSCRVCSGGKYPDKACLKDADCGAVLPGICNPPATACSTYTTAAACGIAGGTNPCGWDGATGACVNRYAGTCSAASLEGTAGNVCNQNSECNPGQPSCIYAARHPNENSPLASPATPPDLCKVNPRIFNIVNADKPTLVDEGSVFTLKFNTFIDANQRPLKEIRIDWGDGTENTLSDLSIAPREDPKFPHVYSHVYHCKGKGVCDPYYIKLRTMDNWDICNHARDPGIIPGFKCNDGLETWTNGPVIQVIR